jgi:hypothetical protein
LLFLEKPKYDHYNNAINIAWTAMAAILATLLIIRLRRKQKEIQLLSGQRCSNSK